MAANNHGFFNYGGDHGGRSMSNEDEDFNEEDVWGAMKERADTSPRLRKAKDTRQPLPTAPKHNGGCSISFFQQSSAPVSVPDWSKIYGIKSSDDSFDSDVDVNDDDDDDEEEDEEGGGVVGGKKLPPHEWLAKKLERSQISSFSVCEGVGRTLKGRDLSKMRDAVLSRTGFLE